MNIYHWLYMPNIWCQMLSIYVSISSLLVGILFSTLKFLLSFDYDKEALALALALALAQRVKSRPKPKES